MLKYCYENKSNNAWSHGLRYLWRSFILNQQTGLMIEASASWLFVFPVLIYTAMSGPKSGAIVGIAMALMTFC